MTRYVVRPKRFITTPRLLKTALGAQRTQRINDEGITRRRLDWNQDFFIGYPEPGWVANAPDCYTELYNLYRMNKYDQRKWLDRAGLPVPKTIGRNGDNDFGVSPQPSSIRDFVVRPLRHFAGQGYRITDDPYDFTPRTHYSSEVFPKAWEYRIVLHKGRTILTLLKRQPEGTDPNQPWNHSSGAIFQTVRNEDNNRLRWVGVREKCAEIEAFQHADFLGIDVLVGDRHALGLRRTPYAICEVNFAPALVIPDNVEVFANAVASV